MLQTLFWVALIVWILIRFDGLLTGFLQAVIKRVNDGAEVHLPGQIRIIPTSVAEQRERLEAELVEHAATVADDSGTGTALSDEGLEPLAQQANRVESGATHAGGTQTAASSSDGPESATDNDFGTWKKYSLSNKYLNRVRDILDAQTLALRYLGAELGKAVLSEVSIEGRPVDGVVTDKDSSVVGIVEVKFVGSLRTIPTVVDGFVKQHDRLSTFMAASSPPVRFIAVVVVPRESMMQSVRNALLLNDVFSKNLLNVSLHVYSLPHLRRSFGIDV